MEMQPAASGLVLLQTSLNRPVNLVPFSEVVRIVRYAQAVVVVGVWHMSAPGELLEMRRTAAPMARPANWTVALVMWFV
jgi:hypothetical protein